jgi:aspartate oxidase
VYGANRLGSNFLLEGLVFGAQFRSGHPCHDDANFRKHSILGRDGNVIFSQW